LHGFILTGDGNKEEEKKKKKKGGKGSGQEVLDLIYNLKRDRGRKKGWWQRRGVFETSMAGKKKKKKKKKKKVQASRSHPLPLPFLRSHERGGRGVGRVAHLQSSFPADMIARRRLKARKICSRLPIHLGKKREKESKNGGEVRCSPPWEQGTDTREGEKRGGGVSCAEPNTIIDGSAFLKKKEKGRPQRNTA